MLCAFCLSTILGGFYGIPEKSPKSSTDKMNRACELKDQTLKKIRTLHSPDSTPSKWVNTDPLALRFTQAHLCDTRCPIRTSTKQFCGTIATSVARYDKYHCWASKDDQGSVDGGVSNKGASRSGLFWSFFVSFFPPFFPAGLKGVFAEECFLAFDVLSGGSTLCPVKILGWICTVSNTRSTHTDS